MNRALGAFVLGLCAVGGLALAGLVWPLASGYLGAPNRSQVQHISGASIDLGPLGRDLAATGLALGDPAHLRLFKRERRLELWLQHDGARFAPFRSYPICAMSGGPGPKLAEGDRQAPEGFYRVSRRQLNPNSRHHLAFNLGYPNAYDLALGRTGSAIMVHGGCSSVGCFAMTDAGIEEIYGVVEAALRAGQAAVDVSVFPFELTETALQAEAGSRWAPFWANLKQGADLFAASGIPPAVAVAQGAYVFGAATRADACTPISGWV